MPRGIFYLSRYGKSLYLNIFFNRRKTNYFENFYFPFNVFYIHLYNINTKKKNTIDDYKITKCLNILWCFTGINLFSMLLKAFHVFFERVLLSPDKIIVSEDVWFTCVTVRIGYRGYY